MAGNARLSMRVAEELGAVGLLTNEQLAWAFAQAESTGESAGRIVFEREFVTEADIARVLEESLGVPRLDLESYTPDEEALALVPAELARFFGVVPMFEIDGVLTVAIGKASDVFGLDELADKIGLEIEAVLADSGAVGAALAQSYGAESAPADGASPGGTTSDEPSAPFLGTPTAGAGDDTPPSEDSAPDSAVAHGSAAPGRMQTLTPVDLDVLAVADARRTSLLVTEIMEAAVARRASDLHVLPYKDDFFLTMRVDGRLEQFGHAPLSMQGALIDGFRSFLHMAAVAEGPSVGRVQVDVSGIAVTVTASLVNTLAGQRLVLGIGYHPPAARALDELGLSESEVRAVSALAERGRGLVLVAAPIGEGGSDTYHALLAHAAVVGRTVYSVERGTGPRIPAVAQVPVLPSSSPGAAAYLAAGLGQDTDVLGIDALSSVHEVHLALEAADAGKLVVAGIVAAGTTVAVRALLDMGAEPVSLAAGVALVIGQRTVRAASGERTAVFELMPATDAVRAAIAGSATAAELEAAGREAGMRPLGAQSPARIDRPADVRADIGERVEVAR